MFSKKKKITVEKELAHLKDHFRLRAAYEFAFWDEDEQDIPKAKKVHHRTYNKISDRMGIYTVSRLCKKLTKKYRLDGVTRVVVIDVDNDDKRVQGMTRYKTISMQD